MYDDHKIKPLYIMLPKTRPSVKRYFLIEDDVLLEKYTIWVKSGPILKQIDNKPVYNKKCLKTKLKYYDNKATVLR